jgi:hypothetical protein
MMVVEAATMVVETVAVAVVDVIGVGFGATVSGVVGVIVIVVALCFTVVGGPLVRVEPIVLTGGRTSLVVGAPGAVTLSAASPPHAPKDSKMIALTVLACILTACLMRRRHVLRLAELFRMGPVRPHTASAW